MKVRRYKNAQSNLNGLHLCSLSDDILASILFSNYLSTRWHDVLSVLLVCKSFLSLGAKHIAFIDYISAGISEDSSRLYAPALKLCYLDLSYNIEFFSVEIIMNRVKNFTSLRGLRLRGTKVNDDALLSINNLTTLRYLDLSKCRKSDCDLITDNGVRHLSSLCNLRWIDLSLTYITDESIQLLCVNNPYLEHLAVSCCSLITDEATKHFQSLRLKTLDVSGCDKLTITTIEALVNPL